MSAELSQSDLDWLTPLAARGPVVGLAGVLTVHYVVQKTVDGDRSFEATFAPGSDHSAGEPTTVELTAAPKVAAQLASGELGPNVAWMSGRLKAAGPTGPLLALLAHAEAVAR